MPPRPDPTTISNPYRSTRAKAWRNAMVAAVNAGLEQGLFGVEPGDNRWPVPNAEPGRIRSDGGAVYRFEFPGQIPALAWVGDASYDELAIHVALWPTVEAEQWVRVNNAGRLVGEVWATGWLERRKRPYLQSSTTLFAGARLRIPLVAGIAIEPRGGAYVDRGVVQL